ncbi:MAG: hypothetical protein IT275_01085 [Chitinophagales bacterium]|nr:hypothetical protein [Chitinophagales bacterium]
MFTVLSAFNDKQTPLQHTTAYCFENLKLFQASLDTLQQASISSANRETLVKHFLSTRIAFKRIEFIIEYLDNNRYPFFNGVNAVEMDEGFDPNAQPEGLQVIESELGEDSLNYTKITLLTNQLKYRTLAFYLILKNYKLYDTYVFEAIRFNLIRIETLSLVTFDSPDFRNNIAEIQVALESINTVLLFYKNDKNIVAIAQLQTTLKAARQYLSSVNFKTLDRLLFIKQYLQPISTKILQLQQSLSIPFMEASNQIFRAVNVKYNTIYDKDFINPKFYAQDKYYKENPLYTALGKKLFFDTRLSEDGTLSCASCHQPSKAMADKLTTSITNQSGKFQKRNTPSIINAALQANYFYDFAALSLETQINHVVINPEEFNSNYEKVIARLKQDTSYVRMFAAAFPEYKSGTISNQTITTCIADYERKFIFLNSTFDKYMRGETHEINAAVKRGFNLFMGKAQCGSCHFAPTFFGLVPPFYGVSEAEVLGITTSFDTINPILDDDIGRFKNFAFDQFKFAIKTSTVRNVDLTAPYMHNGGFKTLEEVVEFYEHGGGAGMKLNVPNQTLPDTRLQLTSQEKKDIVSFMKALTDTSGLSILF